MKYQIITEGFVSQQTPGTPNSVAAGSRCVEARNGDLICTFEAQTAMGGNDFKPMVSRSKDGGLSWSEARLLWPEIQVRYSIFGSISASPTGDLFFYGTRTPIDHPGEQAWSEATNGLKQNELVWTRSSDHGVTWAPFSVIPMPIPGSAEAPGAMCITRRGDMVCCYAPYNTFDPNLAVAHNQVIGLASRDQGKTWSHSAMLSFAEADAQGAESWVIELSDGRLLGTGWHIQGDNPQTNKYAISSDAGATWSPTLSTGILGQSTALAPLPDGRALFVYNQRKHGDIGVWLALASPSETSFGVAINQRVWAAEIASRGSATADFKDWTSFAFGEPSVTPLADRTILITLWARQPSGHGIRYVKLRIQ
ncbi:MAG: exo-alpha-sialidase [Lacunisphaera sp.]|nr:exo-alpha-sialidase [Lacunisphaera sp.]